MSLNNRPSAAHRPRRLVASFCGGLPRSVPDDCRFPTVPPSRGDGRGGGRKRRDIQTPKRRNGQQAIGNRQEAKGNWRPSQPSSWCLRVPTYVGMPSCLCVFVLVASMSRAADEKESGIQHVGSVVASNQGVSLDVTPSGTDAVPRAASTPAPQSDGSAEPLPPRPTGATGPGRTLLRSRAANPPEPSEGAVRIPWYRSTPGSLAIVLALVGALYFCVRRWAPSAKAAESGVLRVVARTHLTPKHGLALVQVGRRFLVIGVSPSRVGALAEIGDPEEVADLTVRAEGSEVSKRQAFETLLGRNVAEYAEPAAADNFGQRAPSGRGAVGDLLRRLRSMTAGRIDDAGHHSAKAAMHA